MTWRDVRFSTFKSCSDIGQGLNDKKPIWYVNPCKDGYFNREKFADEIVDFRHTGYYTDVDCNEVAKGIVVSLPHGKFIAGYYWSSNDERVYHPELYRDEESAAHAADSIAEHFADKARDDDEKYQAARELESDIEDELSELGKLYALRHHPRFGDKDAIADLIESIRDKRETLATDCEGVL